MDSSKNDGRYYLESDFMNKLYFYYIHHGYKNILTSQISNILINLFTVGFVIFICNCIDYGDLIDIKDDTNLGEVINIENFFNFYQEFFFRYYFKRFEAIKFWSDLFLS